MARGRVPLRRRLTFTFWRTKQGKAAPPPPSIVGYWGMRNRIQ